MKEISKPKKKKKLGKSYNWQFWAIIAVPMIYAFVFAYIPMGGIIVAFQKYSPRKGILGSEWVGLKYFKQCFTTPSSRKIIFNTLYLGIYSLIAGFPIPILLAILLNEMRSKKYKKFIQNLLTRRFDADIIKPQSTKTRPQTTRFRKIF